MCDLKPWSSKIDDTFNVLIAGDERDRRRRIAPPRLMLIHCSEWLPYVRKIEKQISFAHKCVL